jgi:hypothetical protein
LDILVQSRRDAQTATRFFRKLLKGLRYVPRVLITDKLAGYGVARRRLMPGVEDRRSKYLNYGDSPTAPDDDWAVCGGRLSSHEWCTHVAGVAHSRTVRSLLPVASSLSSGLNATP